MTAVHKTKWFMPAFCLVLGLGCFAALWAGDRPGDGLAAFGLLAGLAALTLLGGRSDMIRGLRGDGRDEYWARIDIHATAIAGHVTIAAIIAMCFWEWAHGRDGTPYAQLGAIAGLAYLAGIGFLRWQG
jgi:hypothetical protein